MAAAGSKHVVIAALLGNSLIAVTKFAAAAYTGSSAMLSEGIHSLVDTCNQGLLLYGMKRASRPADDNYPFGYTREIYRSEERRVGDAWQARWSADPSKITIRSHTRPTY